MRSRAFVISAVFILLCATAAVTLLTRGAYGWTLFVVVPFALGASGVYAAKPPTAYRAAVTGCYMVLGGSLALLAFAFEGVLCVILALPITLTFGMLGACTMFYFQREQVESLNLMPLLLLPFASVAWDLHAPPPLLSVTSQVVVHAPPERVWKFVVAFPELPADREMLFHTGVAYPLRAHIYGTGPGAIRYCEFSTGPFVEPITTWNEPTLLAFRVTHNPAPMREWSPWGPIPTKHLHGYLVSEHGQFALTPLGNSATLLTGTTWYRHGLWPATYWGWCSNYIIHRIHLRVLNHVKSLAEAAP